MVEKQRRNKFLKFFFIGLVVFILTAEIVSADVIGGQYLNLGGPKDLNYIAFHKTLLQNVTVDSYSNQFKLQVWAPYSSSANMTIYSTYFLNPPDSNFVVGLTKTNQSLHFPFSDVYVRIVNVSVSISNKTDGNHTAFYPSILPAHLQNARGYEFRSAIPSNGFFYQEYYSSVLLVHILPSLTILSNYTGFNSVTLNLTLLPSSTITGFYFPSHEVHVSLDLGLTIEPQNYSFYFSGTHIASNGVYNNIHEWSNS